MPGDYNELFKKANLQSLTPLDKVATMDPAIIKKEALSLSSFDRAQLADALLQSLNDDIPEEILEAWAKESEDRYQAYHRGEIKAVDGPQLIKKIKQDISS